MQEELQKVLFFRTFGWIFLGAGIGIVFESVGGFGGFDVTLNLDGLTASLLDFLVKSWVLNSLMSSIAASFLFVVLYIFFFLKCLCFTYLLTILNYTDKDLFLFDFSA